MMTMMMAMLMLMFVISDIGGDEYECVVVYLV